MENKVNKYFIKYKAKFISHGILLDGNMIKNVIISLTENELDLKIIQSKIKTIEKEKADAILSTDGNKYITTDILIEQITILNN